MFELKLCYVFKEEKTEKKNLIELKIYITIRREVGICLHWRTGDKRRLSLVDTVDVYFSVLI